VSEPHRAPIDELVLTVLSQNTNDRNRDVAYARLRERFQPREERSRIGDPASTAARGLWTEVREAPLAEVTEAIRPGGLAVTKAPRIQDILRAIGEDDLSRLEHEPLSVAREELCELPGVGRKTAACVLLFSYGLPDVPVDTHVHRVGSRLGLFRPNGPLDEAHDEMSRMARGSDPYEAHTALLRHGRRTCVARAPRCGECPLRSICPYARERRRA